MKSVGLSGYSMTNEQLKLNEADRARYSDIYQYCLFLIVKTRTAIPTLSSSGNNGLKDCLFT